MTGRPQGVRTSGAGVRGHRAGMSARGTGAADGLVAGEAAVGGVNVAPGLVIGGSGAQFVGSVPERGAQSATSNELR